MISRITLLLDKKKKRKGEEGDKIMEIEKKRVKDKKLLKPADLPDNIQLLTNTSILYVAGHCHIVPTKFS